MFASLPHPVNFFSKPNDQYYIAVAFLHFNMLQAIQSLQYTVRQNKYSSQSINVTFDVSCNGKKQNLVFALPVYRMHISIMHMYVVDHHPFETHFTLYQVPYTLGTNFTHYYQLYTLHPLLTIVPTSPITFTCTHFTHYQQLYIIKPSTSAVQFHPLTISTNFSHSPN